MDLGLGSTADAVAPGSGAGTGTAGGSDGDDNFLAELRKVVYPTQEQLVTYFLVTMVFVLFFMAFVSLLDLGFGKLAFEVFTGQSGQ